MSSEQTLIRSPATDCSQFPRRGFRVIWKDTGEPVVVERELIGRKGSWTISRLRDGTVAKENGCSWSDTVTEAIEREAESIMWRFTMPTLFERKMEYRKMCLLMREAVEWGKLLGEISGGDWLRAANLRNRSIKTSNTRAMLE